VGKGQMMIETVVVLIILAPLVYGSYKYCEKVRLEMRSQYDVMYYMLSDLQKERLNKNKNK